MRSVGEGIWLKEGVVHQMNLLGLVFWLNITADDDLIHKAHYGSLEMLIVSWETNNCRQNVNTVKDMWRGALDKYCMVENKVDLISDGIGLLSYPNNLPKQ